MSEMREYLRCHPLHAPDEKLWNEDPDATHGGKKITKAMLWALLLPVKEKVQPAYVAANVMRWTAIDAGQPAGHEVVFTPPYHPELQCVT